MIDIFDTSGAQTACNDVGASMREEHIHSALTAHRDFIASKHPNNKIIATVLIGSQNYNMDTDQSDFDTITLIAPTIDDLMNNRMINETYHDIPGCTKEDQARIQDIRMFHNNLKKGAINALEMVYTDHFIMPEENHIFLQVRQKASYFVRSNLGRFLSAYRGCFRSYMEKFVKSPTVDTKMFLHMNRVYLTVHNLLNYPTIDITLFRFPTWSEPYKRAEMIALQNDKDECMMYIERMNDGINELIDRYCPDAANVLYDVIQHCMFLDKKGENTT